MTKLTNAMIRFINATQEVFGDKTILTRSDIDQVVSERNIPYPHWLVTKQEFRYDRGVYRLPEENKKVEPDVVSVIDNAVVSLAPVLRQPKLFDESEPAIPEKYEGFVKFGFYYDLKNIIKSKMFYPVFITGHTGNGKTLSVEQSCAELGRELIRVNISIETDESDLLGGPTLIDGNVVYKEGPVLTAMKRGAVLLIDEIDRGSNKLMCIQGILEGKSYYNKKTGQVVNPVSGFNVIATANTKGFGSEEGKYLAQILDTAFLERFPITVEQEYPDTKTEKHILKPLIEEKEFIDNLVKWADIVRQSYHQGAIDEMISTRRLVHIAKAYTIFGDKMKAIELCVNRFDTDTKLALLDLYSKVDAKVEEQVEEQVDNRQDDIDF